MRDEPPHSFFFFGPPLALRFFLSPKTFSSSPSKFLRASAMEYAHRHSPRRATPPPHSTNTTMVVTTRKAAEKEAKIINKLSSNPSTASNTSVATGSVFCILLALQYGLQPFLKVFIAKDVKKAGLALRLVAWTIPAAINWCLPPYALRASSLPGGARLLTRTKLAVINWMRFDCKNDGENNSDVKVPQPTLRDGVAGAGHGDAEAVHRACRHDCGGAVHVDSP
jgi:hypothetical protein